MRKNNLKQLLRFFIILFTCFGIANATSSAPIVKLTDSTTKISLSNYITVLEDPSGELSFDEIKQSSYISKFEPLPSNSDSYGLTQSTFWLRLTLNNESQIENWILDPAFANIHFLDLYFPTKDNKHYTVKTSGNMRPINERSNSHRRMNFRISIGNNETKILYLRYKNQAPSNITFRLWNIPTFENFDRNESFTMGLFYGLLLVILVLNLTLYFFFKNLSYGFLAIFTISIAITFLFYDSYAQLLIDSQYARDHAMHVSLCIAFIALLYFIKSLLTIPNNINLLHKFLVTSWTLLLLGCHVISYSDVVAISIALILITLLYLFGITVLNLKQHVAAARFLMFGLSFFLISYGALALVNLGLIESSQFSLYGMRFGLVALIIMMSMSMVEHIKELQNSKYESYKALSRSKSKQKESEEKFSKVFYDQPIAMQTIDLETAQRIDVNNYFCELFEYDRKELLDKTAYDLNLWDDPSDQQNAFKRLINNGKAHNQSLKMRTKSGKVLDVLVSASTLDFNKNKLAIVSFLDVSKQKTDEDKLRASNDKFFKIFQSSPLSIIMADITSGEIIEVNNTFEKTFGYSSKFLKNKTTFDINLWKNDKDRTRLLKLISSSDIGHEDNLELLDSSGNTVLVDSHFFKISIDGKNYTISTLLDITEQNRTEQTMRDIAIGVSAEIGDNFYQKLVLQLSKVFDVDYVFIAKINENVDDTVDTLVMCAHGQIVDNISYSLAGTPCSEVIQQQACTYKEKVQNLFPSDALLVDMNIESYVGAPLISASGSPIGLISLMNSKPLLKTSQVEEILQIFAARAAAEIERSHSDLQLQHTQKSLELHVQQTPLAVIEWNTEFKVIAWNPAAEKIFGYSQEEALGKTANELIIPKHLHNRVNTIWQQLIADKGGSRSHNENITKNEKLIICDWYNTPLVTEEGEVIGVTSLAADVTLEEQNQLAIFEKEKEQREILNSTFDGIITIDQSGKILTFNKSSENLFGFSSEEIIGRNVRKLMPPQTASQHDGYLQRYLETREPRILGTAVEVVAQRRDKSNFPMRLSIAELSADPSGRKRFIASCQDLSQIKQQEEQLRRSQKMDALGKLTGGIAHDFNNLLGVILGYSDLLEKSLDGHPKQSRYANQIKRAGDRGAKLTKKLLAFSRKRSADFDVININTLVKNQQHLLEKMLTARITLNLDLEENIWLIEIDEGELEDSILNMSINAMHAIERNGRLTLKTNNIVIDFSEANILQLKPGNYVVFSVTDTGCGIDTSTIDKIFDPFYSTKGEKGTGLGLSQVYGFMESCGGAIKVYSEKDEGTQFTLYFPQHKENGRSTKQVEHIQSKDLTGTETILVLDDELSLRQLAQEILNQKGYQVLTAARPSEALSLLEENSIDLLLSDVIMPEMDGYQLASIVSEKYPTVKIQLASGFTDDRHENIKNDQLHKQLLKKPFTPQTLLLKIRQLFDNDIIDNS